MGYLNSREGPETDLYCIKSKVKKWRESCYNRFTTKPRAFRKKSRATIATLRMRTSSNQVNILTIESPRGLK